jgi:glycosyltransferase involved in cell wall biosynthesis
LTLESKALHHYKLTVTHDERSKLAFLRQLGWSNALRNRVFEYAEEGSVLHSHGLWLMPNIYPAWAVSKHRAAGAKLVHSPRGMLGQAARRISWWKKEPIWWLWQREALRVADCLHATAESEYAEIRQAGLLNPVAIIPNGIDLPSIDKLPDRRDRVQRQVLSLGRIHPKKGLDRLLHAWAKIEHTVPDWSLKLVGNAEVGHDIELLALAQKLGLRRFTLEGPSFGDTKWQVYHDADLFVLPTLNENFGITVAEALASGLPVISTKGAPWGGLESHQCGWWIDHGVEPLAAALLSAMAIPPGQRAEMGQRGRDWMGRDFAWPAIGAEMASVYRWLKLGDTMPSCIRLD